MSRTLHLAIFLAIAAVVFGAGHYYLYARLSYYLDLTGASRKALLIGLAILYVILMATMPAIRMLPQAYGTPLAWFGFTWLGIAMMTGLCLLGCDIAHGLMPIFIFNEGSDERRLFLKRALGFAALGSTTLLSSAAVLNGLRPVEVKPLTVKLAKLPTERNGFKIVQISDLHVGPTINGEWLQSVVSKVNALQPDVIALTGDLVDGSVNDLAPHVEPLRSLQAKHGVLFVTGNHEYYSGVEEWMEHLTQMGVRVLQNERVTFTDADGNHPIDFAGVHDYASNHVPDHSPDLPKAMDGRDTNRPLVLLAHQPAAIREAAAHNVDLQLSGHTHGGQIWPWNYFVYIQQPYVSGLHQHPNSDSQIYVSEGTGYWGPPMRLGTAAEITEITLVKA